MNVQQRISLLDEEEKNDASQLLCEKLLKLVIIQEAQNLIYYQAMGDEISLTPFIAVAQKEWKNSITIDVSGNHVALPKEGVIFVPWRAFTLSGKRIGRGGWWYDKFLQEHPYFQAVGVCFGCQIFPELPQDAWDITMNEVIYSWPQRGQ